MAIWIKIKPRIRNANNEIRMKKNYINRSGTNRRTLAHLIALKELADVVLFDVAAGLAKGKA